jgi:hypothetical protein
MGSTSLSMEEAMRLAGIDTLTRRLLRCTALLAVFAPHAPGDAEAQCLDSAKHFRGGLWDETIAAVAPGAGAQAAVQRILAEMNAARAQANPPLPALLFDPQQPVLLSLFEESDPRGPDGAPLSDPAPNREAHVLTNVDVDGGGTLLVLLTDPLRSNGALTSKGVPGTPAVLTKTLNLVPRGAKSQTRVQWTVASASDSIALSARYSSDAVSAWSRFPGTTSYLECNLGLFREFSFRTSPTATYESHDRSQVAFLLDLTRDDVEVHLQVSHHDPDIDAIFNDPATALQVLADGQRVERWQRK